MQYQQAPSINPIYDCIVLDLDGTLVATTENPHESGELLHFKDMHGDPATIWLHKRPGFDDFIRQCFDRTVVGVWSMGQPGYVEAVVSLFPQKPKFVFNWWNCDRAKGKIFKRLNNIPHPGRAIMVDDKTITLEMCERVTAVTVPEWTPDQVSDTVLSELSQRLFV